MGNKSKINLVVRPIFCLYIIFYRFSRREEVVFLSKIKYQIKIMEISCVMDYVNAISLTKF